MKQVRTRLINRTFTTPCSLEVGEKRQGCFFRYKPSKQTTNLFSYPAVFIVWKPDTVMPGGSISPYLIQLPDTFILQELNGLSNNPN
jgi:hypothetical protein